MKYNHIHENCTDDTWVDNADKHISNHVLIIDLAWKCEVGKICCQTLNIYFAWYHLRDNKIVMPKKKKKPENYIIDI